MIEIKHKGPVMVVSAGELASITMDGEWHILASYSAQGREYVPQRWNYEDRFFAEFERRSAARKR